MIHRLTSTAIEIAERGMVPDGVVRAGIRALLRKRLRELPIGDRSGVRAVKESFIEQMNRGPVALVPEKANEQHYEGPAAVFAKVLGARRKYSAGYWSDR